MVCIIMNDNCWLYAHSDHSVQNLLRMHLYATHDSSTRKSKEHFNRINAISGGIVPYM